MNDEREVSKRKIILKTLSTMVGNCNNNDEFLKKQKELDSKSVIIRKMIEENDSSKLPLGVQQRTHKHFLIELEKINKENFLDVEVPIKKNQIKKSRILTLERLFNHKYDDVSAELIEDDYTALSNVLVDDIMYNYEVSLKKLKFDKFINVYSAKDSEVEFIKNKYEMITSERNDFKAMLTLDIVPELRKKDFMELLYLKNDDVMRLYINKKNEMNNLFVEENVVKNSKFPFGVKK